MPRPYSHWSHRSVTSLAFAAILTAGCRDKNSSESAGATTDTASAITVEPASAFVVADRSAMSVIRDSSLLASTADGSARWFYVAAGGDSIDLERDHYTVSVIEGYISSNDNFWKRLIERNKNLVISLHGTAEFQGRGAAGESGRVETVHTRNISDLPGKVAQPWGFRPEILSRIPGHAQSVVTLRATAHNEDRLKSVIDAVDSSTSALGDAFNPAWMGYARLASRLLMNVFGSGRDENPFFQSFPVTPAEYIKNHKMPQHYVVLIAPGQNVDTHLRDLDASKIGYSATQRRVTYQGRPYTDRSFAVLYVSKAPGYNILREMDASQAPWARLARSQFVVIPVADADSAKQLRAIERSMLEQLKLEEDYLFADLRFSIYDRVRALSGFAQAAIDAIKGRCDALTIAAARCPTSELQMYVKSVAGRHGLSDDRERPLVADIQKIREQLNAIAARRRS